ncbi:hypothetical protein Tco_0336942 [Tanacetum coccineum]
MSSDLSASMTEMEAMSKSVLRKRFRSSYESFPSVLPPDLPSRKRYRGTSELVEDNEEEDDKEDEEIEESMDTNNVSQDAEDEGPTVKNEDPATEDEGLTARVEGLAISAPLGLGYGALRRRELALEEGDVYSTFETPPSHEWTSGLLTISPSHSDVPSPISSPMIPLTVPSPVATPVSVETVGFFTELGAQVEMQGVGELRDEIFSQRYRFKSLEYEQERVVVIFGVIWRPMLALEAWAGQTNTQRVALWHAISDVQGENRDLQLQLAEERRARLELAEVVDGMRRGQEPRGGAYGI